MTIIDARAVDASEFYQDSCCLRAALHDRQHALMRTSRHQISLALLRAKGRPEFTDAEAALGQVSRPHLQRGEHAVAASGPGHRPGRAEDEALDRWDTGVALLDDHGAVLHLNASAKSSWDSAPGLRLVGGRLVAQDAQAADAFVAALHQLYVDGQSRDVLIPGRTPIVVTFCRAPSATVAGPTKDGGVRCWRSLRRSRAGGCPRPRGSWPCSSSPLREARLARAIAAGHLSPRRPASAASSRRRCAARCLRCWRRPAPGASRNLRRCCPAFRDAWRHHGLVHQLVDDRPGRLASLRLGQTRYKEIREDTPDSILLATGLTVCFAPLTRRPATSLSPLLEQLGGRVHHIWSALVGTFVTGGSGGLSAPVGAHFGPDRNPTLPTRPRSRSTTA